ncbi:3360_t:CDS:2 [Paraglomus brasilianum]|uniref:3360_t:CDS:1 n=1 Tax=Paraglomus brasilianum TaxID=144538 RepID=A0A9N9ARB6_9GLOM|nr:3360_t:CDS:2 [Paraglomus brasilianum]
MEKRKSKSVAFNLDPQPMELSDASQPITIPSTTDPDVLQEIPIYFSRQLANKLSLLQYPVRPRAHPYTASHVPLEARLKPKSQVLELDIPLQPNANWYNRDRGRELALGLNDKEAKTIYDKDDWDFDDDDTSREHENLMHKQTLTATIIPAQANYMIGVMHNGQLHLTPVSTAYQLRPGLKYLDRIDEKQKVANKKATEEENALKDKNSGKSVEDDNVAEGSSSSARAKGNKAIQVSVKSTDPDTQGPRKNTFSLVNRLADSERWVKLKYYDVDTDEAAEVYDKLIAEKLDELRPITTKNDYVKVIGTPKGV